MRARIARFLFVGGACALTQNIMVLLLTRAHVPYLYANVFAGLAFLPVGYLLHALGTFRVSPSLEGFAKFVTGVVFGLPVSSTLLWLIHGVCRIPIAIALIAVTAMMAVYGFMLNSLISQTQLRNAGASRVPIGTSEIGELGTAK